MNIWTIGIALLIVIVAAVLWQSNRSSRLTPPSQYSPLVQSIMNDKTPIDPALSQIVDDVHKFVTSIQRPLTDIFRADPHVERAYVAQSWSRDKGHGVLIHILADGDISSMVNRVTEISQATKPAGSFVEVYGVGTEDPARQRLADHASFYTRGKGG